MTLSQLGLREREGHIGKRTVSYTDQFVDEAFVGQLGEEWGDEIHFAVQDNQGVDVGR